MKKYFLAAFFSAALTSMVNSQIISRINLDSIKAHIQDQGSLLYYPTLLKRFVEADTNMTISELQHVYYGSAFQDNYSPYGSSDDYDKFLELYNKEKFEKALPYGLKDLEKNPVNIRLSIKVATCYSVMKKTDEGRKFAWRYFKLLDAIHNSGTGRNIDSAYVVTKVEDEYEMIRDLELQFGGQQALVGQTDVMDIKTPNDLNVEKLYFNVHLSLHHLSEMFRKETKGK